MLRVNTIINQVDKEKIIFSFRHFHADWLRTGVRQTKSRGRETVHIVAYSMYMRICIQSVISFSFFYNQTDRCREADIDILLERICYVKKQSAEKGYLWHSVCVPCSAKMTILFCAFVFLIVNKSQNENGERNVDPFKKTLFLIFLVFFFYKLKLHTRQ
jgi:hypothetical protein